MKCDSHCMFGPGYDKTMARACKDNWLMIPRRYALNAVKWQVDKKRPVRDYHYISFPVETKRYGTSISNQDWLHRTSERNTQEYDIDDTMSFQGSCWFANRKYFMERIRYLDGRRETYGSFGGEQLEIGLKYWLGGGEVKVIKKTWYAHLSKRSHHYKKGMFSRNYKTNFNVVCSRTWNTKHWLGNEEPNMIHPFSWLVEKFWPVPSWPEDRDQWIFPKKKLKWRQI